MLNLETPSINKFANRKLVAEHLIENVKVLKELIESSKRN